MAYVDVNGLCSASSPAYGRLMVPYQLSSVVVISSTKIKLQFNRELEKNSALTNKNNYQLSTSTPGAVVPAINSVVSEDVTDPTYVYLIISEMTDSATYTAEVNPYGPVDLNGDQIDSSNNSYNFSGVGVAPEVQSVMAISKNRVDVVFSETMKDNVDLRNPANYVFDNGLSVLSVLDVDEDTVKLVTSDQTEGLVYELTVG